MLVKTTLVNWGLEGTTVDESLLQPAAISAAPVSTNRAVRCITAPVIDFFISLLLCFVMATVLQVVYRPVHILMKRLKYLVYRYHSLLNNSSHGTVKLLLQFRINECVAYS
jgi:hypothetical protein